MSKAQASSSPSTSSPLPAGRADPAVSADARHRPLQQPVGYVLLFLVNPIGIVILVNYIKTLPKELDEAAAIDGCGYFRFVVTVVFPLIRPAIATVAVLHAIGIWNELILPTIYLTSKNYYPITRGMIVFQGVYGSNWPTLAAAVLIMTLPMVIIFLVLQRHIVSGLTSGAVKG
jgi:raffinose/stachyose/melibiose transport system permease protein